MCVYVYIYIYVYTCAHLSVCVQNIERWGLLSYFQVGFDPLNM